MLHNNISKTISIRLNSNRNTQFNISGQVLEDMGDVTDLGSIINKDGRASEDVQNWIKKAQLALGQIGTLVWM